MTIPPLVEPGPALTPDQLARYARQILIPAVGDAGQRRLSAARVAVIGAGGLGSPVLLYLAAAGVGTIGIIDPDVVTESNLHRQLVHSQGDLGRLKVASARERLVQVNPLVEVITYPVGVTADNALELLQGYHLVLDGTDTFATRYVVNDACVALGVPCVWGSVLQFDGRVSVFWPPRGPCYRCIFPNAPPPGSVPSCAEAGVLGVLCGGVGAVQAAEAIKLITGIGEPLLGRLAMYDAARGSWGEVPIRRDPGCARCGSGQSLPPIPPPDPSLPAITAAELDTWLDAHASFPHGPVVIDVREPAEREVDHIVGSIAIPQRLFTSEIPAHVPADRPVVLYCSSGARSAVVLQTLIASGHPDARHLAGGMIAWRDYQRAGSTRP
ncbi:MAG: molybdopterin-synthase adenylyltransferase MoeB [Actinomycetota bacterium]